MPIALDTDRTFPVVLDSDKGKAAPARFLFRYLTGRQWIALNDVLGRGDETDTKSTSEAFVSLDAELSKALVGWENMPVPYAGNGLLDVLHPVELYEVAAKVLNATSLTGNDLKKSESPSPSSTASCVPVAA